MFLFVVWCSHSDYENSLSSYEYLPLCQVHQAATCTQVIVFILKSFHVGRKYTLPKQSLCSAVGLVGGEDDVKVFPNVCIIPEKKEEMNRGSTVFSKHIFPVVLFFDNSLLFLLFLMCAFLCCVLSVKMLHFYYYHYTILLLLSITKNVKKIHCHLSPSFYDPSDLI